MLWIRKQEALSNIQVLNTNKKEHKILITQTDYSTSNSDRQNLMDSLHTQNVLQKYYNL